MELCIVRQGFEPLTNAVLQDSTFAIGTLSGSLGLGVQGRESRSDLLVLRGVNLDPVADHVAGVFNRRFQLTGFEAALGC
jgi:hypothetical protein